MTTILYLDKVPTGINPLTNFGRTAYTGALAVGAATDLHINTAAKIGIDLHDVIGNPATPLIPGKKARYDAQVVAVKNAYAAKRQAITDGRKFCRLAINLLRPILGERWNTAWQAAGFHLPTLEVPPQPASMLSALRNYFQANGGHENEPAGITAAAAEAAANAIDAAVLAVGTAKNLRVQRKQERDAALTALRDRLVSLRGELEQLLEDDDGAWYEFGFRRPIDGKMPLPVTALVLTPGGAGIVLASWAASSYAVNYRITWRPSSSPSGTETEAGLIGETQFALTGLPSGVPILIGVSARNDSGETAPTEAAIVVP